MRLPIIRGPLRGWWWDPRSRGKLLRVLGGTYELEQTEVFRAVVRPGATVLDVGAHAGYYTLLAARLAGPNGTVAAFEPDPRNRRFAERHAAINRCRGVRVEGAAVAEHAGTAHFTPGRGSGTGRLSKDGTLSVPAVTLDGYCAEHQLAPNVVKVDVEGAELDVLRGAARVLTEYRPHLFLSTHGPDLHSQCLALLRQAGYTPRPLLGDDVESTTEVYAAPSAV